MAATVFYSSVGGQDIATLENIFKITGAPADPTTVSCVIIDPTGATTTHTYLGAAPADITRNGIGDYLLNVPCTITGLWSFVWVGTGLASDIQPGTWTVFPTTLGQLYASMEELKDRLKITDTADDFQLQGAVLAATRATEEYTGRFFYQLQETRTYVPYEIFQLPIDDLVSITALNTDTSGNGVFDTAWIQNTDYELAVGQGEFNQLASGEKRPFTLIRAINAVGGGRFFPYTWAFSKQDRIQIIGTWGWPQVPWGVREATLQTAAELYKLKDAPFGLAGTSEFGVVRLPRQNPYVTKLLNRYVSPRRRVGV